MVLSWCFHGAFTDFHGDFMALSWTFVELSQEGAVQRSCRVAGDGGLREMGREGGQ